MVEIRALTARTSTRAESLWWVSVLFAEECFSRAFHMEGCRRRLIPGSIPTIWKIEPGKQTTTPQGNPCLILSKLQYCVSHEVLFRRSIPGMLSPRHLCDL